MSFLAGCLCIAFAFAQPAQMGVHLSTPASRILDDDINTHRLELSLDAKRIAVSGGTAKGGDWKIYDLTTGKCTTNGMDGNFRCWGSWAVAFSPDKSLIATGGNRACLFIMHADTGKGYWNPTGDVDFGVANDLIFTPDGKYLICTSSAGAGVFPSIRVLDLKAKNAKMVYYLFPGEPIDREIRTWEKIEKGRPVRFIVGKYEKYSSAGRCGLSPDGKTLAIAGSKDGKVPFLDIESGKITKTLETKLPMVTTLQFTPDAKWLLVAGCEAKLGQDGRIEIWDVEKDALVKGFGKHEWGIVHLAISPDKKTLVTGGGLDGFRVWDVGTGKQKYSYFNKEDPRMPRVAIIGEELRRFVEEGAQSAGCAFLPDGKTFLIAPHFAAWKTEIYFHDTATGEPVDFRKRVAELPKAGHVPR